MISVSVLSAGQAENYYDKDDLYHAGKEIDGGRIPDTMKFDSQLGIVNEFISKEEFKNMIAENEKFRTVEFKINLSPEFKEFLKTDQKFIETFNKNFEKSIRAQAKKSGFVLKENSFGYTKDGIITGVTSHNISKEKFSEKFSKINLEKVHEQISIKLKNISDESGQKLFDGTTQPFKVSSQMHTGRIGIDLTFSTSKSISLMRYASPAHKAIIEEAHRTALGNVLKHINQEYAVARVQVEGESKMIHGQLDTYIFNHEQSRLNDPEFHTHVVVANRMECEDGQIRSIEPRDILREQKLLGKYYRMELDRELLSRGIQTEITDREQYFVEVKGVPEELRKEASGRRQEIEAEWERRGLDSGDTHGKGKAVLETRNAKKDADLSLLTGKWAPRMEALQIGISAPIRAEVKAPGQVIKEIEKSTYHFTEREFLQKYKENDPHARIEDIKAEFKSRVSSGEIFTAEKDGQKFYATRGTLKNEALIKENVFNGVKSSWHLNKRDLEGVDLGGLTNGQRNAILDTMATRNQYHAVEGDAGSGKTYMLDYMRQVCEQNNIEIKGMAPSNDAVEGMRKESGIQAETIHKFC